MFQSTVNSKMRLLLSSSPSILLASALTLLAVVVCLAFAPPVSAAPSETPDETWVTDGRVYSMVQSGDRVYLGGVFRQVGPNVGFGAEISSANGQRDAAFPKVDGKIWAVIPDGAGGWYIGGDFQRVGASDRSRLAHVLADGSVGGWNPGANRMVRALALSPDGGRVYAGGEFTSVNGVTRNALAAIDTATGITSKRWNPRPNGTVNTIAVSPDGTRIYAGGTFTTMNGGAVARNRLAVLNNDNGASDPAFDPNLDNTVNTLALSADGSRLYAGGAFTALNGGTVARNRLAAVDAATGAADPAFDPNADNVVNALALSPDGTRLYAGGVFTTLGGGAVARNRLAAVDATTGTVDGWNPNANNTVNSLALSPDGGRVYAGGAFTTISGTARNRLAAVDAATGTIDGWNPNANNAVNALAVSSDSSRIYAGGDFTSVNGVTRNFLAAVDAATGAVASWNPNANNTVNSLAISADGGRVYAGGFFTRAGGAVHNRLAAINAATGAVDHQWNAGADASVGSVTVSGNRVYLGGEFLSVNGQNRKRLAMVDGVTGELDPTWIPGANARVRAVAAAKDGRYVYVAGNFSTINGLTRTRLAALDPNTGDPVAGWSPNPSYFSWNLAVSDTHVYAAGAGVGGTLAAFDSADKPVAPGTFDWKLAADGDVQGLVVREGKVYAGGHFDKIGGQVRHRLVAVDAITGALDPQWTPEMFGSSGKDLGVWAMTGESGPRLYMGGDFQKVSGQLQQGYAQFPELDTEAPTVSSVTPEDLATEVALDTEVTATFSEAMDGTTINDATFTLTAEGSTTPISASVSYDSATRRVVLSPSADLDPGVTYTATVRGGTDGAKDVVGNPLEVDKVWSFSTVQPADTTPPETTIDSGPPQTVNSGSATFEFSSSETGSTFECSLDGAIFVACTSPQIYADLVDGEHSFEVRATDMAGNPDPTPARHTWTVDTTTAPTG